MSSLSDLPLSSGYRGRKVDSVQGFYLPCLGVAKRYDRAVGYFTSGALMVALDGISALLKNGGTIRIVASPNLNAEDLSAIRDGYNARSVVDQSIVRSLTEILSELPNKQADLLAWLISNNILDIRIAVLNSKTPGLYHEKLGVITDGDSNAVSFIGSQNETAAALTINLESIEIFRSWVDGERDRTKRHVDTFERLWKKRDPELIVYDFPEAARHIVVRSEKDDIAFDAFDSATPVPIFSPLQTPDLRPYQREAIKSWFQNGVRGILQMATGTGKTITALAAARRLSEDFEKSSASLAIVIVVPFKDLVRQWAAQAKLFGFAPHLCFESYLLWERAYRGSILAAEHGEHSTVVAIVTNATFSSSTFQDIIESFSGNKLLIVDEMHNLGSTELQKHLTNSYQYRLGLSATPERWFDPEGTQTLFDYFGKIVYSLGLKEAIALKALTPYRYFVHPVELSDTESAEYVRLTDKLGHLLGAAKNSSADNSLDDAAKHLLIRRANLIANAQNKVAALQDLVALDSPQSHTLVYCGTGKSSDAELADTRQVDDVAKRLNDRYLRAATYTAQTSTEAREAIQNAFVNGQIQYLVAMHCLDEGIDIPSIRRGYFLASTSNPKQFIQRRGRMLRPFPGKERAEVHDFLVMLPDEDQTYQDSVARRELSRIRIFAELAENGDQVIGDLISLVPNTSLLFPDQELAHEPKR